MSWFQAELVIVVATFERAFLHALLFLCGKRPTTTDRETIALA